MLNKIISTSNPKIKQIVSLRDNRKRRESSFTIIEGKREIERAWEAGVDIKEIFLTKDYLHVCTGRNSISIYEVPKNVFEKISYGGKDKGILALASFKPRTITEAVLKRGKSCVIVVVEKVEKPGNLGAILRTCDGAGVDMVIVCDEKTDCYNPNVIRSSLGTIFSADLFTATSEEALAFLRKNNICVAAATPSAKENYTKADFRKSVALIVGSEQAGLSDFWLQQSDIKVKIPMLGKADSLNVSASTAVILYELIRQRS